MPKNPCTPFGKEVKKRLIDLDKKQSWLIKEINTRTGLYIDAAYLSHILTGKRSAPKITSVICDILDLHQQGT